jgi:hypothetical protein
MNVSAFIYLWTLFIFTTKYVGLYCVCFMFYLLVYFSHIILERAQITINHEAKNAGVVHLRVYAELSKKCYVTGLKVHGSTITI